MKLPKLKYYYFAMSSEEYADFENTRSVFVDESAVIDIATGQVRNRQRVLLLGSATEADTQFRIGNDYMGVIYVLRIPRELVDRSRLVPVGPNAWTYDRGFHIEHCGVDRFELKPPEFVV